MKIIGGDLGGRLIDQPKTNTVRPMSDKVRAALFNILQEIKGKTLLDVYAGSGALGFEAISRGAAMVEAIEANASVARIINANAQKLNLGWGHILHVMKVETWLGLPAQTDLTNLQDRYDIIVADPPYTQINSEILSKLTAYLKPGGVLVVSHSSKYHAPVLISVELVIAKVYGDTALSFYQRKH